MRAVEKNHEQKIGKKDDDGSSRPARLPGFVKLDARVALPDGRNLFFNVHFP